jgi:hypothetical protein
MIRLHGINQKLYFRKGVFIMANNVNNIIIEGARIGFRNFSGAEGKFNPAGRRNFCLFLDTESAEQLARDGWNIKWLEPRDPDEDRQAYLQIAVSYGKIPPKIFLVTSHNKTLLDEDTVGLLDFAELSNVDIIVRPYIWEVNGKSGIKAYVKSMYATIVEDEFADKYYDVPTSAANPDGEIHE